jgi:hypothetical protein
MYQAWGGKAGLRWAESKLKELELLSAVEIELGIDYLQKKIRSKE